MSGGLLLAIESATERGGVALLEGTRVLCAEPLRLAERHAAALLPAIDALLVRSGRALVDVANVALSIGPGSFTGLRVGLATALGLCFGTERRIVPVPTLAALSLQAGGAERSAVLLDARRGQLYAGLYGPAGEPLEPDCVVAPDLWLESLRGSGPLVFLGSGAELYAAQIRAALGSEAHVLPEEAGVPRPESVGLLGVRLAEQGQAVAAERVELRYLRPPEAEQRRRAALRLDTPI